MKRLSFWGTANKGNYDRCRSVDVRVAALLFFVAVVALSPSTIKAQCKSWNIKGEWEIEQSNGRSESVHLNDIGGLIVGWATIKGSKTKFGLEGNRTGDDIYLKIDWSDGRVGIYRGTIGPTGRVEGSTYDKSNPGAKATWFSTTPMRCPSQEPTRTVATGPILTIPSSVVNNLPAAPVAPPPPKKTIKTTGKPKPAASTGTALKAPFIFAVPTNALPAPLGSPKHQIKVTLSWDGGPDHPYAEVWVKVDAQDETFVVEQGKGTREVILEPGKSYLYILTDAGKRLATIPLKN